MAVKITFKGKKSPRLLFSKQQQTKKTRGPRVALLHLESRFQGEWGRGEAQDEAFFFLFFFARRDFHPDQDGFQKSARDTHLEKNNNEKSGGQKGGESLSHLLNLTQSCSIF